jgi:TFIIF-interacting CTD phosphatase-like protein
MFADICLDLDNTLIYSSFSYSDFERLDLENPKNVHLLERFRVLQLVDALDTDKPGSGNISFIMVVLRPHLQEFLDFIQNYFRRIYIWSAGQYRYVKAIENLLFPDETFMSVKIPHNVFTFEDCEFLKNGTTYKELMKKNFDLQRTLCLDDRSDTFSKNSENGILIPVYSPEITEEGLMKEDLSLKQLMKWLDRSEVRNCQDVRKLDKSSIFCS